MVSSRARLSPMTRLTKSEALAMFAGNGAALARAVGAQRQNVSRLEDGPIPERWHLILKYEIAPKLKKRKGRGR